MPNGNFDAWVKGEARGEHEQKHLAQRDLVD